MNKKILALVAGTMLVSSVGFAAPVSDLGEGQTNLGYDHYNLSHSTKDDNFYLEHGLSDKFAIGVEQNSYSGNVDFKMTDVTVNYKLDKNVHLTVGNRSYDNDNSSKFTYGIGVNTNLGDRLDGYASVTATNISTDWQVGVAYKMDSQTALHLGYKSYKEDYLPTVDGLGFGINYNF